MQNTQHKSSCPIPPSGKDKATIIWLSLIAVSTVVGASLGSVSSGLIFGLLLGLPLIAGSG